MSQYVCIFYGHHDDDDDDDDEVWDTRSMQVMGVMSLLGSCSNAVVESSDIRQGHRACVDVQTPAISRRSLPRKPRTNNVWAQEVRRGDSSSGN